MCIRDRAYQLTKTIWEHREEIAGKHPAGRAINKKNAARYTGTEFHSGATRFYKEIGIWPESDGAESTAGAEKPAGDAAESKDAKAK